MTDACSSKVVIRSQQGLHWILVKSAKNAHEKGELENRRRLATGKIGLSQRWEGPSKITMRADRETLSSQLVAPTIGLRVGFEQAVNRSPGSFPALAFVFRDLTDRLVR